MALNPGHRRIRLTTSAPVLALLAGMLLCAGPATADEYTDMLEDEAAQVDSKSPGDTASGEKPESARLPDLDEAGYLPADLRRSEFESTLRDRYMGSYTFYERLSENARGEAYDEYLRTGHIEPIREKIMSRFLNH